MIVSINFPFIGKSQRTKKASENAVLTSRVIDRPMRPLFPKDYRNDVTLNNMVMSVDPECRPEIVAMLGAAIATTISDIPFDGPCAMTQGGGYRLTRSPDQYTVGEILMLTEGSLAPVSCLTPGAASCSRMANCRTYEMWKGLNDLISNYF